MLGRMKIPELDLPHVIFGPGEDIALARAVEAGVYAQHLMEQGNDELLLSVVAERGRVAAEQFAWVGIRMALKYSRHTAYLSGLPEEELFQDGCVAVAEAIRRYDHALGIRFTTFVHEYLMRQLADGGRHGIGRPVVSRGDRRAARATLQALDSRGLPESEAAVDEVVSAMGLSPTATRRGRIRMVSLDTALMTDEGAQAVVEDGSGPGLDFLALLSPRHRQILQWRYGIDCPVQTLVQISHRLKASPSTVARWQREALAAARLVLSGERTTAAAAYGESATG